MNAPAPSTNVTDPGRYGRSFAEVYDAWYASSFETPAAIVALQALATDGPVLELGVGTGRLAIPLAQSGLRVIGIDSSQEMLGQLFAADVNQNVVAIHGDMTSISEALIEGKISESFSLIFCAFNTVLNLPDFDSITRCLRESREALSPSGRIVIEAFVPIPATDIPATSLSPARVASDAAVFIETTFDPATSILEGRHIEVRVDEITVRPWSIIICSPVQLDHAAKLAGLVLVERWSDWQSSEFTTNSTAHISIYTSNTAK